MNTSNDTAATGSFDDTPPPRPLAYSELPTESTLPMPLSPNESAHTPLPERVPTAFASPTDLADWAGESTSSQRWPSATSPDVAAPGGHRFDPGVNLGVFVGSAVMTAVIAGLGAWLGTLVVNAAITAVPPRYWLAHHLGAQLVPTAPPIWLAASAAIVCAGLMVALLNLTTQAGVFFGALVGLVGTIITLLTLTSGPWQLTLGPAVLVALLTALVASLTRGYTMLTVTRPERF